MIGHFIHKYISIPDSHMTMKNVKMLCGCITLPQAIVVSDKFSKAIKLIGTRHIMCYEHLKFVFTRKLFSSQQKHALGFGTWILWVLIFLSGFHGFPIWQI